MSAWDLWWGMGCQHMPVRNIVSNSYKSDLFKSCKEPKDRAQVNAAVHEFSVVMAFSEKMGQCQELEELIELTKECVDERDVVHMRSLLKKVWDHAWTNISQTCSWTKVRQHDKQKYALRTVFKHVSAGNKE